MVELSDRLKARIHAYLFIELQAEVYGVDLDEHPETRAECQSIVEPWIQSFGG